MSVESGFPGLSFSYKVFTSTFVSDVLSLHIPLPGLTTPRGMHFSEVTDSSAVVHWSMPQSPVDNYRITYVPFEGGERSTRVFVLYISGLFPCHSYFYLRYW